MKRILFGAILCCVASLVAYAQSDSIEVYAHIKDAFTGAIIEDGEADVIMPDSSFVSRCEWRYNTDNDVRTASMIYAQVPTVGKYILRITHPDYFTVYHPIDIRLMRRSDRLIVLSERIGMRRRPKVKQMAQVVVKATKIKMVMKKDTIVYDADAFQLSQGSMLDALIEQLPGVELKDGGVITVNGRQVSSLLLNGKDFFKGSPQIVLENLPAYMVDKVKVYEQRTDFEKMTGKEEALRPLVMDVNLKHQYAIGWIANAEAAYGTEQKYLGRVFALRFTDCSRLTLFGNINNTNDTRRPGQKGDWTPSYLPDGVQTSLSGGAEYFYENRMKTFEWTSNVNAFCSDNNILRHTTGESFFPDGKAHTQSRGDDTRKTTRINTSHRFKSQKKERHTGGVNFSYDKNRNSSLFLSGEFGDDPYAYVTGGVLDSLFRPDAGRLKQLARYRRREEAYSRGENWNLNAPYSLWWMPFRDRGMNDMLSFDIAGSYDRHTSLAFDNYHLEYLATDAMPADYRNRHTTRPSHHYNYNTRLSYAMFLGAIWPTLTYRYSQDYRNGRKDLYRLDRIDGWGDDTEHALGTLPSADTEMQQALDIENSEHSRVWNRRHEVEVKLEYRRRKTRKHQTTVVLTMPVRFEQDRLVYDRSGRHYDLHRSKTLFSPTCNVQQNWDCGDYCTVFRVNYALSARQPELVNTIELINDANPLYIQMGNASLRRSTSHNMSFTAITYNKKFRPLYNFSMNYSNTQDALATERTYNAVTGGYTVRPVNVDGNWRIDGSFSLDRQLGKQKRLSWGNNTSWSYDHNVDMANVLGSSVNSLSTICNLYLREQLTLNYSDRSWNVGAKVRCGYSRLTGSRSDFSDISAWDYSYGINARIPLPWKFTLSTDFNVFSRRGYAEPSLNTDDLVWNMRIERSIMNGNLTFAFDGFDMLHNLSKVTRMVNAQGRTESYTNVLPSYFMGHVIYRLNKQPKNKK